MGVKIACLFILLILIACAPKAESPQTIQKTVVQCWDNSTADSVEKCPPKPEVKVPEAKVDEGPKDLGDLKVTYGATENSDYIELQKVFKETELFENISTELNRYVIFPVDIYAHFGECGEINARYVPMQHQINLCYELITYFYMVFEPLVETEEEIGAAIISATFFTFFHEFGHAMIDVYDLPITGREEDAVDQLSVIMLSQNEVGQDMVVLGAIWFLNEGVQKENLVFWDEHSLDMQRFYNIACLVYGKNPEKYAYLVEEGLLPEERAVRCGDEYAKAENAWMSILKPYFKAESVQST